MAETMSLAKAGKTVTVACKLPNGLILRTFDMVKTTEPAPGGTRDFEIARPREGQVFINGSRTPPGVQVDHAHVGGYALTTGVDAAFFELWMKQNAESDIVRNKLIFAHATDTAAVAKENKSRKSGLEPLDPNKLPVKGIKTASEDEKAA